MTQRLRKLDERCIALDGDGKQCRARAVQIEQYHGDREVYADAQGRTWVRAAFCDIHRSLTPDEQQERAQRRADFLAKRLRAKAEGGSR